MSRTEIAERLPFVIELVRTVRARDTYGTLESKSDEEVLKNFLRSGEAKKKNFLAELNMAVTQQTEEKVHLFYEAVASRLERLTHGKLVITVTMELDQEGFGQVVLYSDPIVLLSEGLRDVQRRFLFDGLDKLNEFGESRVREGMARWEKFSHLLQ